MNLPLATCPKLNMPSERDAHYNPLGKEETRCWLVKRQNDANTEMQEGKRGEVCLPAKRYRFANNTIVGGPCTIGTSSLSPKS